MKNIIFFVLILSLSQSHAQQFKVLAFYTAKNDLAHISFVHEANQWFPSIAKEYNFTYDSTNDWSNLNQKVLSKYQVVLFLDTRPEDSAQRAAFQQYMQHGGAWMGFHFSAFAMNVSGVKQNWDWYHNQFLGSGEFVSNTWRPTSAILKVEDTSYALPTLISSAPNEWYRWKNDLRTNPGIKIIASIDSSSFPLGTGPKQHEIWHSGYYPVVWSNKKYKMVYFNMGHNDMDYEGHTNKQLSSSFSSREQNELIIKSLLKLGRGK